MVWQGFLLLAMATVAFSQTSVPAPDICWRDSYNRGIGSIPNHCGNGTELNGALCYPECQEGFHGVGPVCWERCKEGFHDGGVFCYKGLKSYTKKSHGRTAGTHPGCSDELEASAGLCYKPCVNTQGSGPRCWSFGSGTFDYRWPCPNRLVAIAYASSEAECQKLEALLEQVGINSGQCLYELLHAATGGGFGPVMQCRDKVTELLKQFGDLKNIKGCSKITS